MLDSLIAKANIKTTDDKYNTRSIRDRFYQSHPWRKKRAAIVERDNYECQVCKSNGGLTLSDLIVHHILTLEYHSQLAMDDSNLITVCHSCHNQIHGIAVASNEFNDEWW